MMRTLKTLLLAVGLCALSSVAAQAQVDFSITVAPPLLPVYEQPPCPTDGYLWTPGYWAYDDGGYYWVEGVWVAPPRIGFLWTPGYWGFGDGFYAFHTGYWGPSVGFYGGVNYGYGYGGYGYGGGRWDGDRFRYNTAVTRVNTTVIRNTYVDRTVNRRVTEGRASFNGRGGVNVRPTAEQRQASSGQHFAPTGEQRARREAASREPGAHAAANGGRPAAFAGDRGRGQGGNERAERQAGRATAGTFEGRVNQNEGGFAGREANPERRTNADDRAARGNGLTRDEQQLAAPRENRAGQEVSRDRQEGRQAQRQERQAYEGGRRAEAQQMQREAAGQRAQAGQRQAQAQPAQRQERQPARGQGERHEKGQKHDGQDRQ